MSRNEKNCHHLNLKNEPGFTCADCGQTFISTEERIANLEEALEAQCVVNSKLSEEIKLAKSEITRLEKELERLRGALLELKHNSHHTIAEELWRIEDALNNK